METITTNETAARLRRAITRMNRRLRSSAHGGISPTQVSMLISVENLKSPSLGDLALAEQMKPPSVTRIVKSMQEAGLINCVADPVDRRCTRVQLSAQGRKEITAIRRRKTEFLEQKLIALGESDQRKAVELVAFLETLLEES
jgi:DNA-binding MarR family transcriptional regulator